MAVKKEEKTSEEVVVELEQYTRNHKVNPGLVASFTVEAAKANDQLEPRTETAWEKAFAAQAKKTY